MLWKRCTHKKLLRRIMTSIRSLRKSLGLCPGGGGGHGTSQIEPCTTSIFSGSIENASHPSLFDSLWLNPCWSNCQKTCHFSLNKVNRKWGSDLKKVPAHHVHSGGEALPIIAYTGRLSLKVVPFSGFRYMKPRISLLERLGNLSWPVKKPRRTNSCILWLWISRENVLVCNLFINFKDSTFTAA